jgi:hypothetical protein
MSNKWYRIAQVESDRAMARSLRARQGASLSEEEDRTVVQEARYLGRLEPGMDVCDVDGNKFGTIARVYRLEMVMASTGGESASSAPREEIIETKTGLLGLGKHIYVPFSAIQDVTSSCVFVNVPKDRMDEQGWDVKPDYLDELT